MIIRILLALILFAFPAFALGPMDGQSQGESSITCETTNIYLWSRLEIADFNLTNSGNGNCTGNGTGEDCSANDETWNLSNGAVINSDAVKMGTNGLDLPGTGDNALLGYATKTMDDEGRFGFWMRLQTFTDTRKVFRVYDNDNNDMRFNLAGSDEVSFLWRDAGSNRALLTSVDANLGTGTWYFIEVAWKTSTSYREIFVNGVEKGSLSGDEMNSFAGAVTFIRFGNDADATAQDAHIDGIIWSSDSTQDLFSVCSATADFPG